MDESEWQKNKDKYANWQYTICYCYLIDKESSGNLKTYFMWTFEKRVDLTYPGIGTNITSTINV